MSTEYFVTSKKRREALMKSKLLFEDFLKDAKANVSQLIDQMPSFEGSDDVKEDMTIAVCRKFDLAKHEFPAIQEENHCIGTLTMSNFYWRTENGFRSIRSVKDFLKKHPDFQLEDEYEQPVSIKEFEAIVESRDYLW